MNHLSESIVCTLVEHFQVYGRLLRELGTVKYEIIVMSIIASFFFFAPFKFKLMFALET